MQQEIYDVEKLASLICAQAVTETNLHCMEATKMNTGKHKSSAFYAMQQPFHFEYIRTYQTNKQILRDQLKEKQLYEGKIFSEDLLIRSQSDSQVNIIPFLQVFGAFTEYNGFRNNPMSSQEM